MASLGRWQCSRCGSALLPSSSSSSSAVSSSRGGSARREYGSSVAARSRTRSSTYSDASPVQSPAQRVWQTSPAKSPWSSLPEPQRRFSSTSRSASSSRGDSRVQDSNLNASERSDSDQALEDNQSIWQQSAEFAAANSPPGEVADQKSPDGDQEEGIDWLAGLTDGKATTKSIPFGDQLLESVGGIDAHSLAPRRAKRSPKSSAIDGRRFAHSAAAAASVDPTTGRTTSSSRPTAAEIHQVPAHLRFPAHLSNPTPYDIFHLSRTATQRDVKLRYYELVKVMHPDRLLGAGAHDDGSREVQKIQAQFQQVIAAYEILSDARKRNLYDRTGLGWQDSSSANSSSSSSNAPPPPWWGGRSPRTPDEWAAYNAWSDYLRRSAGAGGAASSARRQGWEFRGAKAHDGFGWQARAGAAGDWSFYGFEAQERMARDRGERRITSNGRLFGAIALITWVLAAAQYQRLSFESARAVERADKRHLAAVQSLAEARENARSSDGKKRLEAMRRRAREVGVLKATEEMERSAQAGRDSVVHGPDSTALALPLPAFPSSAPQQTDLPNTIGHGGPSGRDAHDGRLGESERLMRAKGAAPPPALPP